MIRPRVRPQEGRRKKARSGEGARGCALGPALKSMPMQDRLIDFERVLNFRDFGGWETEDGAKIARGKLYRSAALHDATEADLARLDGMDLRFLVDLRRPEERAHEPNNWVSAACRHIFNDDGAGGPALPPHLPR